jgi:hypothetical protein
MKGTDDPKMHLEFLSWMSVSIVWKETREMDGGADG